LSGDRVPSVNALKDAVLKSEKFFNEKYDYIIELPCVSPFRDHNDIDEALNILINSDYDSVISYVETGEKHPTRLKRIVNNIVTNFCKDYPKPDIGSRRQDFENCYIRNGVIYAMTRECLIKNKSRNGKKYFPFIMPQEKSINIDEKFDLMLAKLLIENGHCNNKPRIQNSYRVMQLKRNKKNKNLLITTPISFLKNELNFIKKKFNITILEKPNKKKLIEYMQKNFDAWICHPSPEYIINEEVLGNAKNLKVIATHSTGTTHIDLEFCSKKNISVLPITFSQDFNNIKASSEFTFLLCLVALRKLTKALKNIKLGHWRNNEDNFRGHELINKQVAKCPKVAISFESSNLSSSAKTIILNLIDS
jgi:D-3-phosphoglycerate dehydrogenase